MAGKPTDGEREVNGRGSFGLDTGSTSARKRLARTPSDGTTRPESAPGESAPSTDVVNGLVAPPVGVWVSIEGVDGHAARRGAVSDPVPAFACSGIVHLSTNGGTVRNREDDRLAAR